MKLYKYRSIDTLDRDLLLYNGNYFWASTKEELNDENEFTYDVGAFFEEIKLLEKLALKNTKARASINRVKDIAEDLFEHAKKC